MDSLHSQGPHIFPLHSTGFRYSADLIAERSPPLSEGGIVGQMYCTAKRAARIRRVSLFAIRPLFRVLWPGANLAYSAASVVCFPPANLHVKRRAGSAGSASQPVQIV